MKHHPTWPRDAIVKTVLLRNDAIDDRLGEQSLPAAHFMAAGNQAPVAQAEALFRRATFIDQLAVQAQAHQQVAGPGR